MIVYIDDSSLGKGGLDNNGKKIIIMNGSLRIDEAIYRLTNAGNSFAKFNDSWRETIPLCGLPNDGSEIKSQPLEDCDWRVVLLFNQTEFQATGDLNLKIAAEKIFGPKKQVNTSRPKITR